MRSEPRPGATACGVGEAPPPVVTVTSQTYGAGWQCPLGRRDVRAALAAMCMAVAESGRPLAGVDLYLLDDAAMARANARHLGCIGPTNVLSFPGANGMPGTLLLSLDTLERECFFYGQEPRRHLVRLLAHGMGHLAGLDHGPEMEALCAACVEAASAGPAR